MRVAALAAALTAVFTASSSVTPTTRALESSCAIPAETLSFECSSDCEDSEACMLASNATVQSNATETVSFSSLTACPLACFAATSGFNATPSGTTRAFTLLVPFGTWQSDMELLNQPATATKQTGELLGNETLNATFASISNDFLKKIEPLKLPFNTTSVSIRGGSKILEPSTKSRVANVEFADNFLLKNDTNQTGAELSGDPHEARALEYVAHRVPSADHEAQEAHVTGPEPQQHHDVQRRVPDSELPRSVVQQAHEGAVHDRETHAVADSPAQPLTLLWRTYLPPTNLNPRLLAGNYIPSFTGVNAVGSIQTLDLTDTKLKAYSAHLLSLEKIYLTGNNLTTIPTVMFRHTRLKELYLDNNQFMKDVALSNKQARFIFNLQNFTIDEAALKTNCSTESQLKLHNYTFCLTDGPVTPQATQQNTPMPTPKAKPTPKPKAAKLKTLKKRTTSVRVAIKTSSAMPPTLPVDNVESVAASAPALSDTLPEMSVKSTALASQSDNDSGENDLVALAVTGAIGGVAVALIAMGALWLGSKAAKRLKQATTSTRDTEKPIQQPSQLVLEDEDESDAAEDVAV